MFVYFVDLFKEPTLGLIDVVSYFLNLLLISSLIFMISFLLLTLGVCLLYFCFSRASFKAYRNSQARGQLGAVAASLCHSHSNAESEPHLQPTPQLTAVPDP